MGKPKPILVLSVEIAELSNFKVRKSMYLMIFGSYGDVILIPNELKQTAFTLESGWISSTTSAAVLVSIGCSASSWANGMYIVVLVRDIHIQILDYHIWGPKLGPWSFKAHNKLHATSAPDFELTRFPWLLPSPSWECPELATYLGVYAGLHASQGFLRPPTRRSTCAAKY